MTSCALFDCDCPFDCGRYNGEFPNQIDNGPGFCVGCEYNTCKHCYDYCSVTDSCLLYGNGGDE